MTPEDKQHLRFIYNRMVEIHGENPNVDYMLKFDKIIGENPIIQSKSNTHNKPADMIYQHQFLHEMYVEDELPDKDFKFMGTDGNIYRFNMNHWDYLLREYGRSQCVELITIINGSIEQLVEMGIATLLLLKAEK